MSDFKVNDDYTLSNCCSPVPHEEIRGYYSHDNIIKIHKFDCPNLKKVEPNRLLSLAWDDILVSSERFTPDDDYNDLDDVDIEVLSHHKTYGIDYSLVVARKLNISKQDAFDRHKKLRDLNLIERVEPRIVQYRKGIVDNKWIKHRNHTYYDLTEKGRQYLSHYRKER